MSSQLGFLGFLLLQSLVIAAVLVSLCDLVQRAFGLDRALTLAGALAALGLIGYASFWLAYIRYELFGPLKLVVLVLLLANLAIMAYRRRLAHLAWLAEPLVITFLFFIVVVTLGFSGGGLDDPSLTARHRFSELLPQDNILPLTVAVYLKAEFARLPSIGDWLVSDRPPLQTGLYLFLTLKTQTMAYQLVASWLQTTFLLGVWVLAMASALPAAMRRMVMLACALLPSMIINTFFTWPKLLATGYLLIVFALLFCQWPERARDRGVTGLLLGCAAALAVLSHGASAFALIGFAMVVLARWRWPSWQDIGIASATLALLYAPWVYFQKFIDPPGNRLLKSFLAGVPDIDPRGVLETVNQSYGALTWHEYVQGRLDNLTTMIGDWPRHLWDLARLTVDHDPALAQAVRGSDFFQFLPSLHVFSLALLAALALLPFMPADRYRGVAIDLLAALCAITAAVVILVFTPGMTINHVNPYVLPVLATVLAFLVVSARIPGLALVLLGLQSVTVLTAYGFMLDHARQFWLIGATCAAATIALYVYALGPAMAGGAGENRLRFGGLQP